MSRDWRLFLDDIVASCQKVGRYTSGMRQKDLLADEMAYDAVLRNLEIIGEAAKQIPDDIRLKIPQVEWRKISGFRDIVVHVYFGIDDNIIWDVVTNKVPELVGAVTAFLEEDRSSTENHNSTDTQS